MSQGVFKFRNTNQGDLTWLDEKGSLCRAFTIFLRNVVTLSD